jgi:hypothetical protein
MIHRNYKPNARNAWSFTAGAVGFQMCSVCYAAMSEVPLTVFLLFATAGAVASLCAVREWKKYFEVFTRHEIQSRLKDEQG